MAYRVMILEDDPFIALDMESVMQDAGYDVAGPVASIPEALDLIKHDHHDAPDCALLDFHVAGGTSEFVARELARLGVPFMFVTGNTDDIRKSLPDHDPLIRSKPVQVERIVTDIQTLLG